jgi:hypothetical protein
MVNALQETNPSLYWESYKTNEYYIRALLIIKTGGTYSYHWVLKGSKKNATFLQILQTERRSIPSYFPWFCKKCWLTDITKWMKYLIHSRSVSVVTETLLETKDKHICLSLSNFFYTLKECQDDVRPELDRYPRKQQLLQQNQGHWK